MDYLSLLIDAYIWLYRYATVVYSDSTAMTVELYSTTIVNTKYNTVVSYTLYAISITRPYITDVP